MSKVFVTLNDIKKMCGRYELTELYVIGGLIKKGWTIHDIDLALPSSVHAEIKKLFQNRFGLPTYIKIRPHTPMLRIGKVVLIIEEPFIAYL